MTVAANATAAGAKSLQPVHQALDAGRTGCGMGDSSTAGSERATMVRHS